MTLPIRQKPYAPPKRGVSGTQIQRQTKKLWGESGQPTQLPFPQKRTLLLEHNLHDEEHALSNLLIGMRRRAKLSIAGVARRLRINPKSVTQYYSRKRGKGGNASLIWFLRYAEATGCKLYLVFPTEGEINQIDSYKPVKSAPLKTAEQE